MTEYIIQIITAFLGTLGFSLFFKSKKEFVILNSIGGALVWLIYLVFFDITNNIFISNLFSAIFAGIYSEIIARIYKTPATTVLIPATVPMIPGASLYYTLRALFKNDLTEFVIKGGDTLKIATSIALGIIIVSTIVKIINLINKRVKNQI